MTKETTSTTLTPADLAILRKPFPADQHKFREGKKNQFYAYINETAITDRIEEVDPAWTLEMIDMRPRGIQSIVTVRLTIKGVSRDGVGMAVPDIRQFTKDGVTKDYEDNEAEKAAATDALRRAARLFGIGRYLLNLPKDVQNPAALQRYLGETPKPTPPPQLVPTPNGSKAAVANGEGADGKRKVPPTQITSEADKPYNSGRMWVSDLEIEVGIRGHNLHRNHLMNVINNVLKPEGAVTDDTTFKELIGLIVAREEAKDLKPTA